MKIVPSVSCPLSPCNIAMALRSVVILFGIFPLSSTERHSLKYFDTVTLGIEGRENGSIPEFVDIMMVDEIVTGSYNSSSRAMLPRPETEGKKKSNILSPNILLSETERASRTERSLMAQIKNLEKRFNHAEEVHVYQRMCGCEWDDKTEAIETYEQYAYDGEDFLSLDLHQMRWKAARTEAVPCQNERNRNRAELQNIKDFLTQECTARLKKFVQSNVLPTKVAPAVSVLHDSFSSKVVCHATGFYPDGVMITWKRDGQEILDDVVVGETLPNMDGTFQKRAVLTVSLEERSKSTYSCEVAQKSGEPIIMIVEDGTSKPGIIVGCVVAVAILIGVIVAIFMKKKKGYKQAADSDSWSRGSPNTIA